MKNVVGTEDRLLSKLVKEPTIGCWIWTGSRTAHGYGMIKVIGRMMYCHRLSYEIFCGPIPHRLCVLHKCDVASCCNPLHLFIGTQSDNVADMVDKGRQQRIAGEEKPNSKLSSEIVAEIRSIHQQGLIGYKRLAKRFGVSATTIRGIISGEYWSHLLIGEKP